MPRWNSFLAFLAEVQQLPAEQRQALVDDLLRERRDWPWVEKYMATFIYTGTGAERVALNLDTIKGDPPFVPMVRLEGTNLWYINREFERDDLLDYLIIVDDPMTPLANEQDIANRISHYWHVDPLNPIRMNTSHSTVSVLRMRDARPFPDWSKMPTVPRGQIIEHTMNSSHLRFTGRKLWVYTPFGYDDPVSASANYPLLIFQDGQWASGPLQLPYIADTLIKHNHLQPLVIAMVQSGDQKDRIKTYVSNDNHYEFVLSELLPFLKSQYRIDTANVGIGGVSAGAIAAAHAAITNPAVFSRLIMLSPPLGKGIAQDKLREYVTRFDQAPTLPQRIFQSVGRYETRARFYRPAQILNMVLRKRDDLAYRYIEAGSGHGLVGFRSVLPEALAWTFPVYG